MSPFLLRAVIPASLLSIALLCSTPARAQANSFAPPASAPQPPAALQWMPPGMAGLAQQSVWHTEFTLDRTMLSLAGNLYGADDPIRQAIARVDGVAVHLYRFPAQRPCDPAVLDSIRAQYNALGLKHVSTTQHEPSLTGEAAGRTDVWLDTHGINLAGATILLAGPTTLNLITVSGNLSTLDLLHLRGHFGIPQFPADALPH